MYVSRVAERADRLQPHGLCGALHVGRLRGGVGRAVVAHSRTLLAHVAGGVVSVPRSGALSAPVDLVAWAGCPMTTQASRARAAHAETAPLRAAPRARAAMALERRGRLSPDAEDKAHQAVRRSASLPPSGCSFRPTGQDDDDAVSLTLNWSRSMHCSSAGLTAVPPVPTNTQFV